MYRNGGVSGQQGIPLVPYIADIYDQVVTLVQQVLPLALPPSPAQSLLLLLLLPYLEQLAVGLLDSEAVGVVLGFEGPLGSE